MAREKHFKNAKPYKEKPAPEEKPLTNRQVIERALNTRTRNFDGGPKEYVLDWIASGKTMTVLADELARQEQYSVSRQTLMKYLIHCYGEGMLVEIDTARKEAAHALIDQTVDLTDDVGQDRDAIAKAKLQSDVKMWVAAKFNRPAYGDQSKQAAIQINVNDLHLAAINVPPPAAISQPVSRAFIQSASQPAELADIIEVQPADLSGS